MHWVTALQKNVRSRLEFLILANMDIYIQQVGTCVELSMWESKHGWGWSMTFSDTVGKRGNK